MALNEGLTSSVFGKLRQQATQALAWRQKYKEKIDTAVEAFVETSVMSATGFGLGLLDGHFLDQGGFAPIPWVPSSLALAVVAHGGAVFIGGKSAPFLHMIGNASAVYFAGDLGKRITFNRKHKKANLLDKITVAGELDEGDVDDDGVAGTQVSDKELAEAAAAAKV